MQATHEREIEMFPLRTLQHIEASPAPALEIGPAGSQAPTRNGD